jgi:hypothetical protein
MSHSFSKSDILEMLSQNFTKETLLKNLFDLIRPGNPVVIEGFSCSNEDEIRERINELGID